MSKTHSKCSTEKESGAHVLRGTAAEGQDRAEGEEEELEAEDEEDTATPLVLFNQVLLFFNNCLFF